jgi:DNA polymerase I-like protein with 3'-5' exonuclease and polymerase domains
MRRLATPVILDPRELKEQVAYFSDQEAFSFDVESTGENRNVPSQNVVNWMSLATHGRAIVIPFGHPNGTELLSRATKRLDKATKKFIQIPARYSEPPDQMRPSEVFGLLEPLFFNTEQVKVAHNATFDLISTAKYYGGEAPLPPYADTIVMQWLLDENLNQKGLKDLVRKYYDLTYDHDNVGRCVEAHALDTVAHYALMDARYTWFLYQRFLPLIEADTGLLPCHFGLLLPFLFGLWCGSSTASEAVDGGAGPAGLAAPAGMSPGIKEKSVTEQFNAAGHDKPTSIKPPKPAGYKRPTT